MEEKYLCESQAIEQPSSTEESIVAMIFSECDAEGTGYVPVLKLIHFMLSMADEKLDRSLLDDLQQMLDPQEHNVDVTRQTFESAMKDWVEKVKDKVISCMDDPDSCHDEVADSVQDPYDNQTSPSSDHALACDLDNSSFSCGGSEAGSVPFTVEMNNLAECVMELKHTKKRLEDQIKDLQSQLHSIENNYAALQREHKDKSDRLFSLQSSVDMYRQLQQEFEDLKDAKAAADEHLVVLKSRLQQVEKEAQTQHQQLSKLDNQKMELVLELEISKKKNHELQKMVIVQKMENEQLLKQCSKNELLKHQQLNDISQLKDRVTSLLSHIKHLEEEKQSLQVSFASMTDEFLSVNSQSSCDVTKMIPTKRASANDDDDDDDEYLSAVSSLFWSMEDNQRSLLAEFEAVNEAPDVSHESTQNTVGIQESQKIQWQRKIPFVCEQKICFPVSDVTLLDISSVQLFHPVTELEKWVCDTDALISIRRKRSLQAKSGGVREVIGMEHSDPSEQEEPSMRRYMSESQLVASGNSGSSVTSETSSCSTDVFPSLATGVLQQLRLDAAAAESDVLSDQDIENKFSALSLAFKTDKLTLVTRHDRQQRQRDQAERNMAVEIMELKAAVHSLNYLCKDSESIEILGKIQDQVDILQQSTELVSSSAEIFGAVQQEIRVSKAIEVMLTHVENLKRMYEKEHAELEETKRVLVENNLVVEGNADGTEGSQKNLQHRTSSSISSHLKQKRRASIAVFRLLNSHDSTKTSNTSHTFGDTKRCVPHSRRTSSSQMDSPNTTCDRKDRLNRPEVMVGSMDGIKELAEGLCDYSVNSDERSSVMEENNNCTGIHKSSHCDSPPEVAGGDVTYSSGNTEKNPAQSAEANKNYTKDSDFSSPFLMWSLGSLRSHRDTAVEFVCRTRRAVVDGLMSLNTEYMLTQIRRCATLVLIVAAFLSIVSTFVPTTAQPREFIPFSWLTLKDILDPYIRLEHYGRPPT